MVVRTLSHDTFSRPLLAVICGMVLQVLQCLVEKVIYLVLVAEAGERRDRVVSRVLEMAAYEPISHDGFSSIENFEINITSDISPG